MGGLFDSPDPPNPIATASAQTGTNVATAVANANLSNVNQVTPQGNLTYSNTGNYQWADPTTGQTYTIPQFTAYQSLNPTAQATLDQSQQAQYQLASTGSRAGVAAAQPVRHPIKLGRRSSIWRREHAGRRAAGADKFRYA